MYLLWDSCMCGIYRVSSSRPTSKFTCSSLFYVTRTHPRLRTSDFRLETQLEGNVFALLFSKKGWSPIWPQREVSIPQRNKFWQGRKKERRKKRTLHSALAPFQRHLCTHTQHSIPKSLTFQLQTDYQPFFTNSLIFYCTFLIPFFFALYLTVVFLVIHPVSRPPFTFNVLHSSDSLWLSRNAYAWIRYRF